MWCILMIPQQNKLSLGLDKIGAKSTKTTLYWMTVTDNNENVHQTVVNCQDTEQKWLPIISGESLYRKKLKSDNMFKHQRIFVASKTIWYTPIWNSHTCMHACTVLDLLINKLPLFGIPTYGQSNPSMQWSSLISEDANDLISLRQLVNVQLDHLHTFMVMVRIK